MFSAILLFLMAGPSFTLAAPLPPATEAGGDGVGNGGDELTQEFMAALGASIDDYERMGVQFFSRVSPLRLRERLSVVKVEFVEVPLYDNLRQLRSALNFPSSHTIKVNIPRWVRLRSLGADRIKALALHEILGLFGLDVQTFEISTVIYNLLPEGFSIDPVGLPACRVQQSELTAHGAQWENIATGEIRAETELDPTQRSGWRAAGANIYFKQMHIYRFRPGSYESWSENFIIWRTMKVRREANYPATVYDEVDQQLAKFRRLGLCD